MSAARKPDIATTSPFAAAIVLLALTSGAFAQEWPTRPVTMVVPFAAGGPTDLLGRVMAASLGERLGQQIVVENVGGAGGMTGASRVARAAPDGYQFLLGGSGAIVYNQFLYKKPLFNAAADFAPVALIAEQPLVLVTRKDLPVGNLAEFIAYARRNQAAMSYGSAGAGSTIHLACVLLNLAMGTTITHVPYRGGAPATQDLQGGRIDFLCDFVSTALPQIEGHAVKAIATLSRTRATVLPDLPTAQEQGLAGFDASSWLGFFLPRNTPAPIVAKLHDATVAAMDSPAVRERLQGLGVSVVSPERRGSDYLAQLVSNELAKWAAPIKASGAAAD
jgi:tripartite-type tricarboxylate transporter receptor subunit TctC